MTTRAPRCVPVDQVEHYYAVSVSFTKSGRCVGHLITFHQNPRHLETAHVFNQELRHYSLSSAAQALYLALDSAVEQMSPDGDLSPLYEQLTLPLD